MQNIEEIRENFPIVRNKVFLNHAAHSPLPKPVANSMKEYLKQASELWVSEVNLEEPKKLFAKLINATPEELAFVPNTSTGLNIVANMLDYGENSNIVTTDLEFPSVVYPWLRKKLNVKVRYVRNVNGKIPMEAFENAIDDDTVAVVVSHVEYANGFKNNLEFLSKLAHDYGAYLVVDAIQSAGAIQVDVKRADIDFLTTACYKWLLSPTGVGFLYIKEELIEEFEKLAEKGIIVSARANGIRVSPHFYNTKEEIDRLIDELLEQK